MGIWEFRFDKKQIKEQNIIKIIALQKYNIYDIIGAKILRYRTIRKQLLTTILISALTMCAIPVNSAMTGEADTLYQEACTAEHQ